ncbi:MAG: hypothetical protein KDE55_12275 [Novosphingobium sp.]|nr:hypothetical protein [Novosphingobium sp.]
MDGKSKPIRGKHRSAVLFMTHEWGPIHRLRFERLRREVAGIADAFILMQKSQAVEDVVRDGDPFRRARAVFDARALPRQLGYPYAFNAKMMPGSVHYPIIGFSLSSDYDFFLLVEYDVEFSGNWGEFVSATVASSPDFASLHFGDYAATPDWRWWRYFRAADADRAWSADTANLKRSFNPVFGISRRALDTIHAAHKSGWLGHHEMLLPTLVDRQGLQVTDLGQAGRFCTNASEAPARRRSTVRWKPPVKAEEFLARSTGETLFHPVKDPWYFDGRAIRMARPTTGIADTDRTDTLPPEVARIVPRQGESP